MCGFVTVFKKNGAPVWEENIEKMARVMTHRGPDDSGSYVYDHVGMGFRRLSIIDIEHGAQPFSNDTGDIWLTFNGEIYNHLELKEWLMNKGHIFHTTSDTEVLLRMYEEVGEETPKHLRGMFGFTIWDRRKNILFGARDPFGIKPIYWTETPDQFVFSSEIKCILEDESIPRTMNMQSFYHYLTFQYVPEPETMFQHVHKIPAGHCFKIEDDQLTIEPYYFVEFKPDHSKPFTYFVEGIREVLRESVKVHRISDVPRGAFLSGGIDSSSLVALLQELEPTKTFSVGFDKEGYSELDLARSTAQYLGTDHHEIRVDAKTYLNSLPKLIWHQDEPLADPAAVGLYFVSYLASKHVKVAFSGEGADEFFGGYNIYREPHALRIFGMMPLWMRKFFGQIGQMLPEGFKGRNYLIRGSMTVEERFIGNAKIFTEEAKRDILSSEFLAMGPFKTPQDVTRPIYERIQGYDDVTKMQYVDIHTWLRGDILMKADKMSMANSLELRVPFVDPKVFEFAATIPTKYKIAHGTTKYVLREAMKDLLPPDVKMRKKLGFPVPIRVWLRDEFYHWAKEIIETSRVDDYINKDTVRAMLEMHKEGKGDYSRKLWTILVFMVWHQIYVERYELMAPVNELIAQ